MRPSKALSSLAAASVLAVALGGVVAPAASADSGTATFLYEAPNRTVSYSPGGALRPMFAAIDKDGDKVIDAVTYCIEPRQAVSSGVYAGTTTMTGYSLSSYSLVDAGRLSWVVANGFPSLNGEVAAARLGVDVSKADPSRVAMALQAATQAAVYRYSNGYTVSSTFRFDTRSVAEAATISALFQKAYQYLVVNAVPLSTTMTVWDSKPGDPASQGLVEVPAPGEPTKPTDPTKPFDPTKPLDPSKIW